MTRASRVRRIEDGPLVITIPVLLGGSMAGHAAPLPLEFMQAAVSPDGRVTDTYYGHAVSYPGEEVVFEAMVAERDKLAAGQVIWRAVADRIARSRWPCQPPPDGLS